MEERHWIRTIRDPNDGRRREASLTIVGQKKLMQIHQQANERVNRAWEKLTANEQKKALEGLNIYARALRLSNREEET